MDIPPADLARLREHYGQGRYRAAYDIAVAHGPLRAWAGTPARLIGGRLAIQLGAPTLGRQLHLLAFRATSAHPEAIYYHARYRLDRFGPLGTWQFLRKHPDWSDAPPELYADWLALSGFVAARLRDFDRAERWLNRADTVAPNRPWPCVERASAYEIADRLDDALVSARRSLTLHPWFRPGVQSVAHILQRLGRDREALDFLTEGVDHLESGLVVAQLATLQNELGHHADAARSLDRYADLSPLMDADVAKWLAARRSDTAYFLGDYAEAARHASAVGEEFHTKFAERVQPGEPGDVSPPEKAEGTSGGLTSPGSPRAILHLDLAAGCTAHTVYDLLARFWKHPLPGPSAESPPPVDGLPDAAERRRAEQAGWATREFTLSSDAAAELIARGVPFVVTLVEAGFSQPRLAVGADRLRNTVSLVDGTDRRPVEAPLDGLLQRFTSTGPRCLALVPAAERERLECGPLAPRAVPESSPLAPRAVPESSPLAPRAVPESSPLAPRADVSSQPEASAEPAADDRSRSERTTLGNDRSRSERTTLGNDRSRSERTTLGNDRSRSERTTLGNDRSRSERTTLGNDRSRSERTTLLPDADAYERLYAVQKPLLAHDRPAAVAALETLRAEFPGHRLALYGELVLARYDAHPVKVLRAVDSLLELFPHDPTFVLAKAAILRELNRTPERAALLEAEGQRPDAEPMVTQSLAQVLLPLANRQDDAERLLRQSIRARPGAAAGYYLLATQWWEDRRFDEAAEVYRFACTLEEREDQFAEAYFRAAQATEQVPEVVRLFQQRAGRAAVPTPAATRALYQALLDRGEPEQAFAALEQSINKLASRERERPELGSPPVAHAPGSPRAGQSLGELLLFRAECHAAFGRLAEADADLADAKLLVSPVVWLRAAARVARIRPDLPTAVVHTLELLKHDPLSIEGHRTAVALLTETDGRAAARSHLAQVCRRFPHYYPLLKLRAEFLSGDPDADADRAIEELLEECDADAWALRQRALVLADRKRHAEALAAATRAGELEPEHPWFFGVAAQVYRRADRPEEAAAALHDALRRNIDQEPLIVELVQFARGRQEKDEALQFVSDELDRQPHTGEGLVAFVAMSHQTIDTPEGHVELLERLEEILDARPDLWHAWSVMVQQMAGMNRLEEAAALAREGTTRFPLLAKLWLDRAQVAHATGNGDGRVEFLRQAVAVAPGWSPAARDLAEALDEAGDPDEAVVVLERNAARSPLDPMAHGFLAEWLWEAGRSREALDRAKLALRNEPGYDWAWHAIQLWADRLECPDEPHELARELTRERAGDPRVWLRLTRLLHHPRHGDEVLAALDRAITLDPKLVEAHDRKAEQLAELGRYDEALAAAQPPQLLEPELPILLQGRLAWVEARRGNYAAAIPPMQALVSVDPKYVWGWQQLAEWFNEMGRSEDYLEAASELVDLQPGHPVAMTMRGEAKLQTGDRDGGKADLRDALKVAPNYSPAAVVLFEAHLIDEEFREARQALAVLQEHAAGPEVAVKQIQLACRTGDAEGATRSFAEVCEGPGQSPFPIQTSLTEMRKAGWEDRALRVLRESWQNGGPFHPWAPVFWADSPDGEEADPDTRLRAAEAAIRAYPKFVPAHDTKAEQLALAGRFDEAIAACRPAELGESLPVELRGRAAWIEAKRGDRAKAVALMKQLVADVPDYVLGWRQLAAWYEAAGRHRDCLEASDHFVKLEPENPVAYVYRGEARRNLADRRGALADFHKAFDLDPAFDAAGLNLISEQLAAGDTAGAARTLAALREHADGPVVQLRAVQVACRQGEFEQALMHLRALAADPEVTRGMLNEAAAAFDVETFGPRLTAELKELALADDASADLAGIWAERAVADGSPDAVADRLTELLAKNPDAGREVLLAYMWALAEANKPVQGVVTLHSEVLRSDDEAWARAGRALVAAGHFAHATAWLADWRDREDVAVWMLHPLALALRALDQDDRAIEVCRAAVKLGGPDELLAYFRAWLALDLALSGQAAEAALQLARVDGPTTPDGTRLVAALAGAVVMVQQAGPGGKASAFAEAKEHIKTAAGSCAAKDVPLGAGRAYRKVVSRLAAVAGTFGAKAWALWQRVRPWVR